MKYEVKIELYIPQNEDYFGHWRDKIVISNETIIASATKARVYLRELVRSCEGHVLVSSQVTIKK